MHSKTLLFVFISGALSCGNSNFKAPAIVSNSTDTFAVKKIFPDIFSISTVDGFTRIKADSNSFAYWLRQIHLKKDKMVHLYNGELKANQDAQFAVLDIPVGDKNLQQCADAVMRLRAEYLFAEKRFAEISFTDNAGQQYNFGMPYTKDHFESFMERVFGMCGSASLSKQLKHVEIKDIQAGDVFIHGGFPGHAEIVVDVAENKDGKKMYMLAQSYMPAQDIHILKNPSDENSSPWYEVNDNNEIITPEYIFKKDELKRWR